MTGRNDHWDNIYSKKDIGSLSWYRPSLDISITYIRKSGIGFNGTVFDVGGGASTLPKHLIDDGYQNIWVNDISEEAIRVAKEKLGKKSESVIWKHGDITEIDLAPNSIDFWHDRAVFHFLTSELEVKKYIKQVERSVKSGGNILIGTFGLEGPEKCSGLEVRRYSSEQIHQTFGTRFQKIGQEMELHKTPWGSEQQFVYCYCVKE